MAIARITTWSSGQVLTASALNAEIDNVINNPLALISPLTGTLNANNNQITNLRLENRTTNPTIGQTGGLWFRSDLGAPVLDTGGAAAYIPAVQTIAKGSVVVATGATGYGALAAGSNGSALIFDSSQALGVRAGTVTDPIQAQVFS